VKGGRMKSRGKEGNRTIIRGESVDKIKQRRKMIIAQEQQRRKKSCKDGQTRLKKGVY
jgi:hypothetical protein